MAIYDLKDLVQHIGHDIECVTYGNRLDNATIECMTCSTVLYEESEEPVPTLIKIENINTYEGEIPSEHNLVVMDNFDINTALVLYGLDEIGSMEQGMVNPSYGFLKY